MKERLSRHFVAQSDSKVGQLCETDKWDVQDSTFLFVGFTHKKY